MKPRRHPDKQITQRAAEAQLRVLLTSATDEAVLRMDVASMQRSYRVDPRLVETLVLAEQGKRRRRVANG